MLRFALPLVLTASVYAGVDVPSPAQNPPSGCDSSPLVVANTNVWTRRGTLTNRDVFFRDGRVAAVEQAGSGTHAGFRRIDGGGHTLLPGLIDSHLHFVIPGGVPSKEGSRTDVEDLTARQVLRSVCGRHLRSLAPRDGRRGRSLEEAIG